MLFSTYIFVLEQNGEAQHRWTQYCVSPGQFFWAGLEPGTTVLGSRVRDIGVQGGGYFHVNKIAPKKVSHNVFLQYKDEYRLILMMPSRGGGWGESDPRLRLWLLFLSYFRTKTIFGFLIKNDTDICYRFFQKKSLSERLAMFDFLTILAKNQWSSDNNNTLANMRITCVKLVCAYIHVLVNSSEIDVLYIFLVYT